MNNLLIYLIGVFIFVFMIIIAYITNKTLYNKNFSFLNYFPFEISNRHNYKIVNFIVLFTSIIFIVANMFSFIILPTNHVNYFLSNVIGSLFIIEYILFFSIFYFRFEKSYLYHNIISSFFSSLSLILDAFGVLYILRSDCYSRLYIIIFALFFVIKSITIIVLLINGINFSEKVVTESGTQFKRRKIIFYAFFEWINIVLLIITNLIYLIILK